uniref:Protein kinase domain-containing protein n=1 Tax=Schizophyllum commune (strain H4-8 / FGSC 9210) TaxID=578458 RepID=D8Q989_SCHCM
MGSTEHSARREISILRTTRHLNIVRLFEAIDDTRHDKIYLVMENVAGGPIQWQTCDENPRPTLTLAQTRRIMRDVCCGLDYPWHVQVLMKTGIIHRDIKPSNIVWSDNRTIAKIVDFGDDVTILNDPALFPPHDLDRLIGTPKFIAPEIIARTGLATNDSSCTLTDDDGDPKASTSDQPLRVGKAVDVWALGVTFFCLLFGHTPFNVPHSEMQHAQRNQFVLYQQIREVDWMPAQTMGVESIPTGGRHPTDKGSEGYAAMDLLDNLLQKDPRDRLSLEELRVSESVNITLYLADYRVPQRHPYLLQDIQDPQAWLRATSSAPLPHVPPQAPHGGNRWVKRVSKNIASLLHVAR